MSNFKLNIFTPEGIVLKGHNCDELIIPTSTGIINVLKDHTHILSELGTGTLVAKSGNGERNSFKVSKGLCKVLGDTVTILAKTSEVLTK